MKKVEREYSSKGIIRDIVSMQKFLTKFVGHNIVYDDLVKFFLDLDFQSSGTPYPSIKELQDKLGINYSAIRKKLNLLYEDMSKHEQLGIEYGIINVEYVFYLEYFDNKEYITINQIPVLPRVGEQIWFPFFREKVGSDYFHVKRIDHYFSDSLQSILITLSSGSYNLFWHLKKDEDYEKGNLSFDEYHTIMDYRLKQRYGFRG